MQKLIDMINHEASVKTKYELDEDYCPADNGNYNDAYSDGEDDGWINCCRWLIKQCEL